MGAARVSAPSFNNTAWLAKPGICWTDILKVCHYFLSTPRPNLYIRQLPLELHTKFIEDHNSLLQSVLDFLIPSHIRDKGQKAFAERYFLKYDEPLIRIRRGDTSGTGINSFADISIPLSAFKRGSFDARWVLIAENKMNFLTLPCIPGSISIWSGGGFQISHLRDIPFLQQKKIVYWGDIDEHGFQILHQLRSYYPASGSIMMDRDTFDLFRQFAVTGARNKPETLDRLTEEEAALYAYLKTLDTGNRLEQEKIPQWYADGKLYGLIKGTLR